VRNPAISRNRQGGVGLIEVLVAVLVLSIGFLGVAALQARSLSTNNSAMARSMATIASYSILDAMRADLVSARAGNYNGSVSGDSCPSSSGTLSSAQLGHWCDQLARSLGAEASTQGTVNCNGAGNCIVTIQFDDGRAGLGGTDKQQIVIQAML